MQTTWNRETFSILNAQGAPWTPVTFASEEGAQSYLDRYRNLNPHMNLKRHKVSRVSITVRALKHHAQREAHKERRRK